MVGQTTAVLVVYFGLDYELPIWACLAVIALAAWLVVALRRFPMTQRLEPDRAAWLLAFDIAELAVLLFFTEGCRTLRIPVSRTGSDLGYSAAAADDADARRFCHRLRHRAGIRARPAALGQRASLELPAVYVMGVWLSILLSIAFIGLHAWQITEESRQLADALAATELVLAREQHLSQPTAWRPPPRTSWARRSPPSR